MEFASKAYFLLLLLLIPYILWYFLGRKKSEPTMRMSDTRIYQYAPKSMRVRLIHLPMVLRCICFVLIVCAMARPQTHTAWDNKTVEGIDIMLAMDETHTQALRSILILFRVAHAHGWRILLPVEEIP
jgi:Ca-activated chloride channel family protein